jgi:hypothetical protein
MNGQNIVLLSIALEELADMIRSVLKEQSTTECSEIIDRKELLKRLAITEPTAIRWGKRGTIPEIRVGSNVRYNWPAVVKALENEKRS